MSVFFYSVVKVQISTRCSLVLSSSMINKVSESCYLFRFQFRFVICAQYRDYSAILFLHHSDPWGSIPANLYTRWCPHRQTLYYCINFYCQHVFLFIFYILLHSSFWTLLQMFAKYFYIELLMCYLYISAYGGVNSISQSSTVGT